MCLKPNYLETQHKTLQKTDRMFLPHPRLYVLLSKKKTLLHAEMSCWHVMSLDIEGRNKNMASRWKTCYVSCSLAGKRMMADVLSSGSNLQKEPSLKQWFFCFFSWLTTGCQHFSGPQLPMLISEKCLLILWIFEKNQCRYFQLETKVPDLVILFWPSQTLSRVSDWPSSPRFPKRSRNLKVESFNLKPLLEMQAFRRL